MLWELDESSQGKSTAAISHLKVAELRDGHPKSCILVREDSSIEIYKFTVRSGQPIGLTEPTLVFEAKDTEAITGCIIGHVTSAARSEILFTCYSGSVKSLVDRRQARKLGAASEDVTKMTDS